MKQLIDKAERQAFIAGMARASSTQDTYNTSQTNPYIGLGDMTWPSGHMSNPYVGGNRQRWMQNSIGAAHPNQRMLGGMSGFKNTPAIGNFGVARNNNTIKDVLRLPQDDSPVAWNSNPLNYNGEKIDLMYTNPYS